MEIDRAKAIADVDRVIVDSAKAEVDFMRVTGKKAGTGFIPLEENPLMRKPDGAPPRSEGAGRQGLQRHTEPGTEVAG
jgi:hypothetical protein